MGTATVRLDGTVLDLLHPSSGLEHSTVYRVDGFSGDYQASVRWAVNPNAQPPCLLPGRVFEVLVHGRRLWGGVTTEPDVEPDGSVTIHAVGFGAIAGDYDAIADSGGGVMLPSTVPNDVVDAAIARGAPWRRFDDLGATAISDPDGEITTVAQLLQRAAQAQGKRVHFDSHGEITYVTDPTTPLWTVGPGDAYLGTADDQFLTALRGYYISSVDGAGVPDGWALTDPEDATSPAIDTEAAVQFGYKERTVKLLNLGLLTSAAAHAMISGRFSLIGGRMGWTNGVDLTPLRLRRVDFGPANPHHVRAGQMLRVPGVTDARSSATTRASIDLVLGEVRVTEDEGRGFAAPVGFSPRDFEAAVAPPEKPAEVEVL